MDLDILCKKLEDKQFHIHDLTMEDIFKSNPANIIYICSHCGK